MPQSDSQIKLLKNDLVYLGLWDYFKLDMAPSGGRFQGNTLLGSDEVSQILKWISGNKKPWKIIYKATVDGFTASSFRTKCSMKGPTITVIKSTNGNIFGGYTPLNWKASGSQYEFDTKSFLFSFKNKDIGKCKIQIPNTGSSGQYSIYQEGSYGPVFGGGFDLYICDNCSTTNSSYSNLGYSFTPPSGYSYGATNTQNYLAGSYNFTVSEIEVFAQDLKK